ncbi:hypothetical protein C8R45DRAFT_1164911 [Mycena sanguinolenta]|nr:hypothetical protein C8R45DRAFT_1164911 [Mycena sanguinolenta]
MASSTHKKPPRTASELELLDSLSGRDVMEFQNHVRRCKASLMLYAYWPSRFTHPASFAPIVACSPTATGLILPSSNCFSTNGLWNSVPDATLQTTATVIQAEPSSDFLASLPPDQAKLEPDAINVSPADPIRTQEIEENGRKVIEILSDSETDDNTVDSDVEVMESLLWGSSRSSSLPPVTASDPEDASRDAVFAAQQDTRRREGTTVEDNTALFFDVISKRKCPATDSDGTRCQGKAKLMYKKNTTLHSQRCWIPCDGWRKSFKEDDRTSSVPADVDERMLDTPPCTRIVSARTGGRLKHCAHAHIVNGAVQTPNSIRHHPCKVKRTIYVPEDETIRKAVIYHKAGIPHRHPIPPLNKLSLDVKQKYEAFVETTGCVGATVNKVDNGASNYFCFSSVAHILSAKSTQLLLGNQTPAMFSPALLNQRAKSNIVTAVKAKKYPLDSVFRVWLVFCLASMTDQLHILSGALQLYREDLEKLPEKRYIHCFRVTDDGGVLIITGVPFLIKLLDDPGVRAFDDDTSFKRVAGEMNEWELALFFKAVERAVTSVRAYTNRSSADAFEMLFDELQKIKKLITGKVLGMKRFVPGGHLLVMNADMEAAQVIGAARSIMKTNVPEYSGIPNDTPASVAATYFVKICYRHVKEAIHDFKKLLTPEQYNKIMEFISRKSKRFQAWWDHKEMSDGIIRCLVKELFNIHPEDWDTTPATTNTGEIQHHWTNAMTGTKLSLVEAIESAREVDERTVRDIEAAMKSSVLANSHNDAGHRLSRNLQRQSKAARKVRENDELTQFSKGINAQLADLKESRWQATAKEKELREQLKVAKGTSTGKNESAPALHLLATGTNAGIDLPFSLPPNSGLAQDGSGADFNFDPQFIDLLATSGLNNLFMLPNDGAYFPNYCVPDMLPVDGTSSESLILPDSTMPTAWGPTTMDELLASDLFSAPSAYSASDPNHAIYLGIGGDDISQIPALPAPPSPSVGGSPSPYPVPLPVGRKRRAEVDEANIIHSTPIEDHQMKLWILTLVLSFFNVYLS